MTDDLSSVAPEQLNDPLWRLKNLYYIRTKSGEKIKFDLWDEQQYLYDHMWHKNLILKSRQRGMTTFIQLFMLDRCLFKPNTRAGVVAHTSQDASAFFNDKIRFAYENLPEDLKAALRAEKANVRELAFSNGSSIAVSTSHRSGTLQLLHVSELGKLAAQFPQRAAEVRAGALNTIAVGGGNIIFIESTAEGRDGYFYDLCQTGLALQRSGAALTSMDFKMVFFPWHGDKDARLYEPVSITKQYVDYFDQLESESGIVLDDYQKAWYFKKAEEQGEAMHSEFPSTPEEAFSRTLKGVIFAQQVFTAREEKRICQLPFERGVPVDVYWDLGYNDINAMWFNQKVGAWNNFINYYESRLVDMTHYIERMHEMHTDLGYNWGTMYLPHDGKQHHISAIAGTSADILRQNGFKVRVVDRPLKKIPSIEAARRKFSTCRFDIEKCDQGIKHLENYRWTWDDQGDTYRKTPLHNNASNGADAFQTFGWYHHTRGEASFADQRSAYSPFANQGLGRYTRGKSRKRDIPDVL